MSKEKLSFNNGNRLCFSVKENNLFDFYNKIIDIAITIYDKTNEDVNDDIIELRLDYLINKKIDIKEIINCISKADKYLQSEYEIKKQFIATIRSFANGGYCIIDDKKYLQIVEELYNSKCVDAIDIDYDLYKRKSSHIKKLFVGKKTLIITYTCMDKVLSKDEYIDLIDDMLKTPAYILKIQTKAFSTEDTENLMDVAKDSVSKFKKHKKQIVIISTGRIGMLSRIWHEYSNSVITYLDPYKLDMIPNGDIDIRAYTKFRKIIKKLDKSHNN